LLPWQTIWIIEERFLNGAKWEYATIGFYTTEALLWFVFFLFMIWHLKQVRIQMKREKFYWSKDRIFILSCLLFIVYGFLSVFSAPDVVVAFQHAFYILEGFLLFFMLAIGPLSLKEAVKWFVLGAVVQSILGIWQFLFQSTIASAWFGLAAHPAYEAGTSIVSSPEVGRWLRAYGAFSHPNVFGGYLVISLTATLVFWRDTKRSWMTALRPGLFIIQTAVLFFTFSRSAWIAFFVCVCTYSFFIFRQKKIWNEDRWVLAVSFVGIAILSAVYFPLIQTRFFGESFHEVRSTTERVVGYTEAVEILRDKPFFGVGAGNYTAVAYALHPDRPGWEYQPVHNVPLLFLVEFGLAGLLLLLVIMFSFLRFVGSDVKKHKAFFLLFPTFLLPLLLFDHYLLSSYIGLLLSAVFFGFFVRFVQTEGGQ
jgi:hypothetical protein